MTDRGAEGELGRLQARLAALVEIGHRLAATDEGDLDTLLSAVADELRALLSARVVVVLVARGEELAVAAISGLDPAALVGRTIPLDGSKSGSVLATGRSVLADDVDADPDVAHDLTRSFGASTGLWVPLVARGRSLGVLAAHDNLGPGGPSFDVDDLRLAETFANQAAVAVDVSERVARETLRRIVAAQELERRRLARELHDETGQALTSLLLGLRSLEATLTADDARGIVAHMRELTVTTLQDVRRLSVELRPKALDDFGLVAALERLAEAWHMASGIEVSFTANHGTEQLPTEVATALYRIVQEALTNIVKHANAAHASILLTRQNTRVLAVIEDDGSGFDFAKPSDGVGLEEIRERVALLGGRLDIESSPDAGTTIVAEVPVP